MEWDCGCLDLRVGMWRHVMCEWVSLWVCMRVYVDVDLRGTGTVYGAVSVWVWVSGSVCGYVEVCGV